jgi:hypothetical protein
MEIYMENQNWIETKKECEVNEEGLMTVKKVTLELKRNRILGVENKEFIDIFLKFFGLVSIATPILLFYFQQFEESKNQRALSQIGIYSNTAMHLHKLLNKELTKAEFDSIKEIIFIEFYPQLVLFSNDSIIELFEKINYNLSHYSEISNFIKRYDTLIKDTHSIIISELQESRAWEALDVRLDSLKFNTLIEKAHILRIDLIDYNIYMQYENIYNFPFLKKARSDGYYYKIYTSLNEIEAKQTKLLDDTYWLEEQINKYLKFPENKDRTEFNLKMESSRESIIRNERECYNDFKELIELKDEYFKYIKHLVHNLNIQYIKSNRFLNKD